MHWLETAAAIAFGWTTLSVVLVVAWSRFMDHLARKERELGGIPTAASAAPDTYQIAA